MKNDVVYTKTKFKTIQDDVYRSPVDHGELKTRKFIGIVLGVLLLLLAIIIIF